MYIDNWFLIVAIVIGLYMYSKKKDTKPTEKKYSYKLDIQIEPNWFLLYKKLLGSKSSQEIEDIWKKKRREVNGEFNGLFGNRYYFTEYYDSATGLVSRFQRVISNNKQYFYSVDEFGDRGYIFDSDNDSHCDENQEMRGQRDRLSIEIGEHFIRNDIFDKNIGGLKGDWEYNMDNYLFNFPLSDVFNFLFTIGQRFQGVEENVIIKWPDNIEKKFRESGIEYQKIFEFEPNIFDIEKYDKDFFEKIGRPIISSSGSDQFHSTYLKDKNGTYYGVKLKIFSPEENDRIF